MRSSSVSSPVVAGVGEKIAGRREGCPKTGPAACQVRSGIVGAPERERPSRNSGDSRLRGCENDRVVGAPVLVLVLLVEMAEFSSGGLDVRDARPVLGVLAREAEVSIRRTAGGRWRRRVRKE